MFENMAKSLFATAMQNPAIARAVEDAAKNVLDVHARVVRIEQKLDAVLEHINNGHGSNAIGGSEFLAIADHTTIASNANS